jgi:hypothetical protein
VAVLRVGRFLALIIAAAAGVLPAGRAHAQNAAPAGTVFELPLPGGVRAAATALNDRVPPDRGQFLVEVIRRAQKPATSKEPPDAQLQILLDHVGRASAAQTIAGAASQLGGRHRATTARDGADTLPLPLAPAIWTDVIFGGRSTPQTLLADILRSRSASRLYCALLTLDDDTRAWLTTEPALLAEIAARYAAPFLLAAPGVRVSAGTLRVPGGQAAEPVWQALAGGRTTREPAELVRALLSADEGRLAYFFGAMSQAAPTDAQLALNLDAADPAARVDAGRRLYAVYGRLAVGWRIEDRPFLRPSLDPALLAAELARDERGRPRLPGTRSFWAAALADADAVPARIGTAAMTAGEPIDFASLSEQVFKGGYVVHRRPYQQVLFASRMIARITQDNVRDALDAVRAAATYPSLVASLERAHISDVAVYAAAARRAAQISTIGTDDRTTRALAQFQGLLALIVRASSRGSFTADQAASLVASLSAISPSERGEYEGRLSGWLARVVSTAGRSTAAPGAANLADQRVDVYASAVDDLDRRVLDLLAGTSDRRVVVDWEGTRYRVDLAAAELSRISRLLGERARPYVSSSQALASAALAIESANVNAAAAAQKLQPAAVAQKLQPVEQVARAADWEPDIRAKLDRLARSQAGRGLPDASALVGSLRLLADELLARGVTELAYAVALGDPERTTISAGDAAHRHRFGFGFPGTDRSSPWMTPMAGSDRDRDWHVRGSLLGIDVRLAELSLISLSARPPLMRPTLVEADRRVFVESVVLMEPEARSDAERDAIASAMRSGRERVAALRTPEQAASLADEIHLGPLRRTLLAWTVAHDPDGRARFLSPGEIFAAGLGGKPVSAFAKWGLSAEPRSGCLCLAIVDRPWETLSGRWDSGIFATSFPDLNLRLAELLAELKMPAALLGPVLSSATHDFITSVTSRDQDDRRALAEFVHTLPVDRVEQYLALLTTDGPLVPLGDSTPPAAGVTGLGPSIGRALPGRHR